MIGNLNWIDDVIRAICLLLVLVLSACGGSNPRVPVIERPQPKPLSSYRYVVNKGDTLYSIAWRYGLDFKQLAQVNAIPSPYTIKPGQQIRLSDSLDKKSSKKVASNNSSAKNKQAVIKQKAKKPVVRKGIVKERIVKEQAVKKQKTQTPRKQVANTSVKQTQKPSNKKPLKKAIKKAPRSKHLAESTGSDKPIKWAWPINGKVIKTFSVSADKYRQGIDLSGRVGDPIKSAASGVVVYAGDKLPGYGNLVIIKHSSAFLSAYAHNRRIYVKEGQKVSRGEKIADMGRSGTSGAKLHFQIRQDGKATNPLKLLPHRG